MSDRDDAALQSEAFALADLAVFERDMVTGATKTCGRLRALLQLTDELKDGLTPLIVNEDVASYTNYRAAIGSAGAKVEPLTLRIRTTGGDIKYVQLWERVVRDGEGKPVREITALQDLTRVSIVQAQQRLTDRLTSLGTMAAGVAHEINNPLAFVIGNLNVVRSVLAPLPSIPNVDLPDLKDAVNEALEGAERMRQIVSSLKPFSRVDEGHRGHCDIARILQASVNMAKNELRQRARVVTDIRAVPPVMGNEAKLSQVFLNLLINAAQAMPDHQASKHLVTVATREEAGHVIATVIDTGSGIAPEVLPRIFDPFFSTKQIGQGAGLGLFVSLGIVKETGGTISVQSKPGAGSTFTVRLPIAQTHYVSGTTPVPQLKRQRILVVDDEPAILRALERMLARTHELTLARNGKEALALLGAGLEYDMVLCDLMMPDVSGIEIWQQLSPAQQSKCVFMTGGTFTDDAERFVREKSVPIVEKPFTASTLEGLLKRSQSR
ncbi:MAG: hybrid sensor histidine kinase/response regulator [Archangium sp.]|nr:hybrid sensor histidine kinase/response regulator [Archangium sp.]